MKKLFFILIIGFIFYYLKFGTDTNTNDDTRSSQADIYAEEQGTQRPEDLAQDESTKISPKIVEKFKSFLSKELSQSEVLNKVQDFSIDPKNFFSETKISKEAFLKNIKTGIPNILQCIDHFCGAEPTEDGLFEANGTLAHSTIETYLEILAAHKEDLNSSEVFSEEEYLELLKLNNSGIQKNIIIILADKVKNGEISASTIVEYLQEDALPVITAELINDNKTTNEGVDLGVDLFKYKDPYSAVLLAEGLQKMTLNSRQLDQLAAATCRFSESENLEPTNKRIRYNFNTKAEKIGEKINWSHLCPK